MAEQCCGTCYWARRDHLGDYICVNDSSDNCTDYVEYKDTCEEWEDAK
jgi:hypothetical protein